MNNMLLRALSGSVYVALIVLSLLFGHNYNLFSVLMGVFAVIGVLELEKLLSAKSPISPSERIADVIVTAVSFICTIDYSLFGFVLLILSLYIPVRMIIAVNVHHENAVRSFLYSLLAIVYVAVPLIIISCAAIFSYEFVLVTFVIIWLNDTGAYLTGRAFGRTKLCERLSPKKTWEGFFGGLILSMIAGYFSSYFFSMIHTTGIYMAIYAAIVSVLGTFGDLFESMIKRTLGVKDSGNIIPGHGGILDRIDSLLAVAPGVPFVLMFIASLYAISL